jgi:RimJ/RimL family protein N-acetyltransferase
MLLRGAHVLVRPVNAESDAVPLFSISHPPDGDPSVWTYLPDGPYESPDHLRQTLIRGERSADPLYFTLVRIADERPLGVASYLRITPELGVIEIGHIWFGLQLQRTTAATEAIYLLMRHVFDDLGYRRLEWKCNALNAASRRAERPSVSGSPSRASFASIWWSRDATVIPPGMRSPRMSGRRSGAGSRRGLPQRTWTGRVVKDARSGS